MRQVLLGSKSSLKYLFDLMQSFHVPKSISPSVVQSNDLSAISSPETFLHPLQPSPVAIEEMNNSEKVEKGCEEMVAEVGSEYEVGPAEVTPGQVITAGIKRKFSMQQRTIIETERISKALKRWQGDQSDINGTICSVEQREFRVKTINQFLESGVSVDQIDKLISLLKGNFKCY